MSAALRPRVLLLEPMVHQDGEALLAEETDVHVLRGPSLEAIREAVKTASAVYVRTPARLLGEAIRDGRELVIISTSGRGTDAIDIGAATECGVAVVNNPGHGPIPVSEHTLGLMLDLAKRITRSDARIRRGDGWADRDPSLRMALEGRTLGVIGLGLIGTEVARKCIAAFHMRVLAYDPYVPAAHAAALGATLVPDLVRLLREADIVTIHAELNRETRGMIGEAELRLMRPHVILVNAARGAIVQEPALVRALGEGWIRGAALDVFDPEPLPPNSPLLGLENLIITPHVANMTPEAVQGMALSAATQILQALRGERPPHLRQSGRLGAHQAADRGPPRLITERRRCGMAQRDRGRRARTRRR
jgi:D-3-phosphoglycerate dehydrogenase/microcystin synthetase protein McyI